MIIKKIEKLTSCLMAGVVIGVLNSSDVGTSLAYAAENSDSAVTQGTGTADGQKVKKVVKQRTSVHDPSIIKADGKYYVFGSHIEAAESDDLQNWTKFTNSYQTPGNVLFGDLSQNLKGSFAWAGENDSDCTGGYAVWAPCVVYNKDYVNTDGTKGAYMMYYCTSSTYKRSAIGYAVSQNVEGPYTYVNTIVYSGFTKGDAHDAKSTKNTNYNNTNLKELIADGTVDGVNDKWFNNGEYNTSYAPNALDPEIFWDQDGTMWMNYGSWSGGIYMLKMDPQTGMPIYPGKDSDQDTQNPVDRYFGERIGGGYTKSGEGSELVYDKDNGYYYLYMSYAGLAANGGYNIRMFRSKNVNGPYVDAAGNNAALSGSVDNSYCGIKLIGNYKFNCLDKGYKAAGHNSSFIDDDDQMYLIYHQRFNDGTETHQVRVHQMFINEDGWPCTVPYEYSGDKISETGYSKSDIVGNYEFINHGTDSSSAMLKTLNVRLNDDFTISGDVTGTWGMKDNTYYMNATIDGVTYKGVFFNMQDESGTGNKVMTFSAIGSNNESIWGSKLELNDDDAVKYAGDKLTDYVPSDTKTDIKLPSAGAYDTKLSWKSSDEGTLSSDGAVTRGPKDKKVTLTCKATKGSSEYTKTFEVNVKGKLDKLSEKPIYKYEFNSGENELNSTGTKSGSASLEGTASVTNDSERGNVLSIKNDKGVTNANYLKLPEDTFKDVTDKGFSVGMWVNVDKDDPNYFEHSALFEADKDGTYPMTRISANLYGRINASAYADATEISKPLKSNTWQYVTYTVSPKGIVVYVDGEEVARQDKDISDCFKDNLLTQMNNVRVGSGAVWNDADIGNAKFDNVAIYDKALNDEEAEALYNDEVKSKSDTGDKKDKKVNVEYKEESSWDNNIKSSIKITNNTDKTIENWQLKFNFDGKINNIYQAEVKSNEGKSYVIKNADYNQDIKPGQSVEVEFLASYDGSEKPSVKDAEIVSDRNEVNNDNYSVKFSKNDQDDGKFNGELALNNTSDDDINNWQLEFDYDDNIENIWNADIISHEGAHYVIKCKDYNEKIKKGGSTKFNFIGSYNNSDVKTSEPANFKLSKAN